MLLMAVVLAVSVSAGSASEQSETEEEPASTSRSVDRLLDSISPEESKQLLHRALARHLKVEREQVVDEIRRNILYSEENVARAILVLDEENANTRQDNIERICEAFAQVDAAFASARALMEDGPYRRAADELATLISLQEQSWYGATKLYVYAICLVECGDQLGALEAFGGLVVHMPDRVSFASSAAAGTARTYEQLHHRRYALKMYRYVLRNYGTSLGPANHERLVHKIHELEVSLPEDGNAATPAPKDLCVLPAEDSTETPVAEQNLADIVSDLLRTLGSEPDLSGTPSPADPEPLWGSDEVTDWGEMDPGDQEKVLELAEKNSTPVVRQAVRSYHERIDQDEDE
jgi:tetratricopeptide (TPR) repeat protein